MNKLNKYLILVISVTLFGEIYFYPFQSQLRFSTGIIALNLIILITEDISKFWVCILSGISVFLTRSGINLFFSELSIYSNIASTLPAVAYYTAYGLLIHFFSLEKHKNRFIATIFLFALIDATSNILEAFIRDRGLTLSMFQLIIVVAFIRSIIAYFIYVLYKNQELFILNQEHQKRYIQLNLLISNIQAEMFYLKKSMIDIESVMSKSYKLYEQYKDNKEFQNQTLDIAREVHEIKKDYYRVISGFESFLNDFQKDDTMTLTDMLNIIQANTYRYLDQFHHKRIEILFDFQENFLLHNYYNLFTILNNLIVNAIDACDDGNQIQVAQWSDQENLYFSVKDDGDGIPSDILPYIFNPGFTTKYDLSSGKASTGIGLSHVKNILESLHGKIDVISTKENGTLFTIALPKKSIIG